MTANRRLAAQVAAHTRWSRTPDRAGALAAARRGLLDKFLKQVDPNNELSEGDRQRMAESARAAFYKRMALKSAQVRAAKKKAPGGAT